MQERPAAERTLPALEVRMTTFVRDADEPRTALPPSCTAQSRHERLNLRNVWAVPPRRPEDTSPRAFRTDDAPFPSCSC